MKEKRYKKWKKLPKVALFDLSRS